MRAILASAILPVVVRYSLCLAFPELLKKYARIGNDVKSILESRLMIKNGSLSECLSQPRDVRCMIRCRRCDMPSGRRSNKTASLHSGWCAIDLPFSIVSATIFVHAVPITIKLGTWVNIAFQSQAEQ